MTLPPGASDATRVGGGDINEAFRVVLADGTDAFVKTRADADKKGLASFDAEAAKNPGGELGVKLGEVYYGFGDYQKAVDSITAGLQKGQIKHLDEAYVYLGLAEVQLKNFAEAKRTFVNLKIVPNISPRVLKLWSLYAETVGR